MAENMPDADWEPPYLRRLRRIVIRHGQNHRNADHGLTGPDRLVMTTLIEHARKVTKGSDCSYIARPGIATLVRSTGFAERTVCYSLRVLQGLERHGDSEDRVPGALVWIECVEKGTSRAGDKRTASVWKLLTPAPYAEVEDTTPARDAEVQAPTPARDEPPRPLHLARTSAPDADQGLPTTDEGWEAIARRLVRRSHNEIPTTVSPSALQTAPRKLVAALEGFERAGMTFTYARELATALEPEIKRLANGGKPRQAVAS